jgi:hypothetical protein
MSKKLQPIMTKLTSDSVPASTKFLPASMSLLMVNSVIGASSTSVSTVLPPTVVDQYASKVIEKCLKIGNTDFLDRYLERICEGRPDRPRMPLIDSEYFSSGFILFVLTSMQSLETSLETTSFSTS